MVADDTEADVVVLPLELFLLLLLPRSQLLFRFRRLLGPDPAAAVPSLVPIE